MNFETVPNGIRSVAEGGGVEKYVCFDALFLFIMISRAFVLILSMTYIKCYRSVIFQISAILF